MPFTPLAFRETPADAAELDQLKSDIDDLFTYHPWDEQQIAAGTIIKTALGIAYEKIIRHAPPSPNRTRALNALTDARMLANAAISFRGKY